MTIIIHKRILSQIYQGHGRILVFCLPLSGILGVLVQLFLFALQNSFANWISSKGLALRQSIDRLEGNELVCNVLKRLKIGVLRYKKETEHTRDKGVRE